MAEPVKARVCDYCGKPKAVTWYRVQVNGKMQVVKAHLHCFQKHRPKG